MERQLVQIPAEQVNKLKELDRHRTDLAGYPISKKVHILLQEKLADIFGSRLLKPGNEIRKGDWFEYIREPLPAHVMAPIAIGVVKYSGEMIGKPFTRILVATDGSKTWWCNYKEDICSIGNYLISAFIDRKFSLDYHAKYISFIDRTRKFFEKYRKEDLSKFSNRRLSEEYAFACKVLMQFHALSFDIDAIDIVLEEKLKEKLKSVIESGKKFGKHDFNTAYSALTTPSEASYINKEQLLLYEISKKIIGSKKLSGLFKYDSGIILPQLGKYPSIKKCFSDLEEKYWWTGLGWTTWKEKGMKEFVGEVKSILSGEEDIGSEIGRIRNFSKSIISQKKQIASDLSFDEEMLLYMDIFGRYAALHDCRKELQMKGTFVLNRFLCEISGRYGCNYDLLLWHMPSEIMELMNTGKADYEKARKRKEASLFLFYKDSIEEYTGEAAIRKREEELAPDVRDIRDFKGLIASFGKATGKAKVCFSASEASGKIKKGDILVASMTTPDYLPAMKKAAAIVTDEGGITSHAAIVSRELKIPCVVGTRVATKVLKDNTAVEVNANHGSVKVLD